MTELLAVLDETHASMVLDYFAGRGTPLSANAARQKATKLGKDAEPNLAAESMIENGWTNWEDGWRKKRQPPPAAAPPPVLPAQEAVDRTVDPSLFESCERVRGKAAPQGVQRWFFAPDVVAEARRQLRAGTGPCDK